MTDKIMHIENWTPEQKEDAQKTKDCVEKLVIDIKNQQESLETNFARLGNELLRVRSNKYWIMWNFNRFNDYLENVASSVYKGRTQLYATISIAERLLPISSEQDVVDMGISKASALANAIKKADGKKPSEALLASAKDSKITIPQFAAQIAEEYEFKSDFDKGLWFDLSGVFLSADEREEFYRAVRAACLTDPPISPILENWSDNKAAHLRKDILQRWIMSFLSEHGPLLKEK
jgi:hypothetical protein